MSKTRSVLSRIPVLSQRERRLISLAVLLILGVGLIHGVFLPGMSAVQSAESRRTTALAQHEAARDLAKTIGSAETLADASALANLARETGFSVVGFGADSIRVEAPGPAALLAWIAGETFTANPVSVTVEPLLNGGIVADLRMDSRP